MSKVKPSDYSKLTVLIIDDAAIIITSIRMILIGMGFKSKNIIHNRDPLAGIYQARNTTFDIVLCGYDFGMKLNGRKILEEMQHYKLLNSDCVFIIMTGEPTGRIVRSIIELSPDEFMLKPYTLNALKMRIKSAYLRKKMLSSLYEADINNDFDVGVSECNKLLIKHPKYHVLIQQFLGKFYRNLKRFDEAEALYKNILAEKDYDWAYVSLANTLIEQEKDATPLLDHVLSESPNNSNALMAKANLDIYNENIPAAIEHLSRAAELTPGNSERELVIANLYYAISDYTNALLHYRSCFFNNKDTYRDTSTSILNYTRAILYTLNNKSDKNYKALHKEALSLLSTSYKNFDSESVISEMELISAHIDLNEKRLHDAYVLLRKVYKSKSITCFYGQVHLCMLLEKLNCKKEFQKKLNSCQENESLNESELIAKSKLAIIKSLIKNQKIKDEFITKKLHHVTIYKQKNDEQQVLNNYIEIQKQSPYLQNVCLEIVSSLAKSYPSQGTKKQIERLIKDCHNTVEQMMSQDEKNSHNYYKLYDLAIDKIEEKI